MKKPILLLKKDIVKPIEQAIERIENIKYVKTNNTTENLILEGLFTLAISSFENSLVDTMRILLIHIPQKLDIKSEQISKEDLINENSLMKAIETRLSYISYKSIKEIIDYFVKTTGIDNNLITNSELNILIETKATRNLLIHNNLIENSYYIDTAGTNKRQPTGSNKRLTIDNLYLFNSLSTINQVLNKINSNLLNIYSDYTQIRAIK